MEGENVNHTKSPKVCRSVKVRDVDVASLTQVKKTEMVNKIKSDIVLCLID